VLLKARENIQLVFGDGRRRHVAGHSSSTLGGPACNKPSGNTA
jgi:hypothetical protein